MKTSHDILLVALLGLFFVLVDAKVVYSWRYENATVERPKRSGAERFECANRIKKDGISLINFGIKKIAPKISVQNRFYKAIDNLYIHITTTGENDAINILSESVSTFNNTLKQKVTLERTIIYIYTDDTVFGDLNERLRAHDCTTKQLDEKDKKIAPYAAALMAVLINWDDLKAATNTTYRGSFVTNDNFQAYQGNSRVVWLNFGSSSESNVAINEFTGNAKFNIENTNANQDPKYGAKLICKCSKFEDECEALYPPGSVFEVAGIKKDVNKKYDINLIFHPHSVQRKRRSAVSTSPSRRFCIYTNGTVKRGISKFLFVCLSGMAVIFTNLLIYCPVRPLA